MLTTEGCLLNANRNPGLTRAQIEELLLEDPLHAPERLEDEQPLHGQAATGTATSSDFSLTAGEILQVAVGGAGSDMQGFGSAGGGGSFVVGPGNTPLVIALTALLIGTLDIADALIFYAIRGVPPIRILQGIASGLLGRTAAFSGGARTALLGLALHFFIAASVATIYILVSRSLPLSRSHE